MRLLPRWALLACVLCGGCGWHPLYGGATSPSGRAAEVGLAQVAVAPIGERSGQLLRLALQQRFGRFALAEASRYDLQVSLAISSEPVAIQPDSTSTFNRVIGSANWTLLAQTPQRTTVASGFARDVDGFNIINGQYFAADLENDTVQRRIAEALADRIAEQLAAYFSRQQVAASR